MVVLRGMVNNTLWGLNGDRRYLVSAFTRAKLSLTVVVMGREE